MELNTLFYVALLLIVGSLFGHLAALIKLPTVTGYIFGGLLLGPSFFHIVPEMVLESMDVVSEVSLAFISSYFVKTQYPGSGSIGMGS